MGVRFPRFVQVKGSAPVHCSIKLRATSGACCFHLRNRGVVSSFVHSPYRAESPVRGIDIGKPAEKRRQIGGMLRAFRTGVEVQVDG